MASSDERTTRRPLAGSKAATLAVARGREALRFSPALAIQTVVLAGLFFARFYHVLFSLWHRWKEPNWNHSYLVPLFSLWFLYVRRHKLKRVSLKREWLGLGFVVLGMGIEFWCSYFLRTDYGRYLGLLVSIFGVVLYVGGWPLMRHAWVSVVFLIFMMPVPYQYYEKVAAPLQELAAKASVGTLNVLQVNANREGTVIRIPMPVKDEQGQPVRDAAGEPVMTIEPLNVAEACAGLRLLVAFIALGVAFAYMSDKAMWQRLTLILSTVPIAVFCNMVRVSGTGVLFRFVHRDMAKGFYHEFAGWVMLLVAMGLLFAISALLSRLSRPRGGAPGSRWLAMLGYCGAESDAPSGGDASAGAASVGLPATAADRLAKVPAVIGVLAAVLAGALAGGVAGLRLGGGFVVCGLVAAMIAGVASVGLYEKGRALMSESAASQRRGLLQTAFLGGVAAVLAAAAGLGMLMIRGG